MQNVSAAGWVEGLRAARRRWLACATLVCLVGGALPSTAHGQPLDTLQYSADIPVLLAGSNGALGAHHRDYVAEVDGRLTRYRLPGIPERANLDALHLLPGAVVLFSLDTAARIDGLATRPSDVVVRSNGVYAVLFDGRAAGVPDGVDLDAVGMSGGDLLVSFDRAFAVDGMLVRPADVVIVRGDAFAGKLLDAAALGLPAAADIDAVDLPHPGILLVSFADGGRVGGIVHRDDDIMQLELATATWSLRLAPTTRSDRWHAADLDALATSPAAHDIFHDGFE
jgi:hypothetical protein